VLIQFFFFNQNKQLQVSQQDRLVQAKAIKQFSAPLIYYAALRIRRRREADVCLVGFLLFSPGGYKMFFKFCETHNDGEQGALLLLLLATTTSSY